MDFQSLLPSLLPIALGFGASVVSFLAGKFLPQLVNSKYYTIVAKLYPLLDPLLAENIKPYGESGVRVIIQEVALAVADGNLSPGEVTKVVNLFLKEFDVTKAVGTPVNSDALLILDAVKTATSIEEIDLSGIKFSFK